jgi:hypothetical protein
MKGSHCPEELIEGSWGGLIMLLLPADSFLVYWITFIFSEKGENLLCL